MSVTTSYNSDTSEQRGLPLGRLQTGPGISKRPSSAETPDEQASPAQTPPNSNSVRGGVDMSPTPKADPSKGTSRRGSKLLDVSVAGTAAKQNDSGEQPPGRNHILPPHSPVDSGNSVGSGEGVANLPMPSQNTKAKQPASPAASNSSGSKKSKRK